MKIRYFVLNQKKMEFRLKIHTIKDQIQKKKKYTIFKNVRADKK